MTRAEMNLAAIAGALVDKRFTLTAGERNLIEKAGSADKKIVAEYKMKIASGEDVLGNQFCLIRSREKRRNVGATYTPHKIVDAMIQWAARNGEPARVVDPGIGSGRFASAAARRFPNAKLIGVDIDSLALLMARANACIQGYADRLHLEHGDYRAVALSPIEGKTLFIGNPPYVRHHEISERWKTWFAATADRFGFKASKLAGLHIHFFLRTREIAKDGDFGAFITAAEWLDTNYGSTLRLMLADGLGGSAVHVIDPKAQPFSDTLTTGAITCFQVGSRPSHFAIRAVHELEELAPLDTGNAMRWNDIAAAPRWSIFVRSIPKPKHGEIEVGELFKVHRGQVTGCNEVWISRTTTPEIPSRFLFSTITKSRELFDAKDAIVDDHMLRKVIDLPVELDGLGAEEREAIRRFLKWARHYRADASYVAKSRRAWWSVGLRSPAPIICTYMARRAPTFVRNRAKVRHINIAHGLYPVEFLTDNCLDAIAAHLRRTVTVDSGRLYAGGLAKFEPGEVQRLHIPAPNIVMAS